MAASVTELEGLHPNVQAFYICIEPFMQGLQGQLPKESFGYFQTFSHQLIEDNELLNFTISLPSKEYYGDPNTTFNYRDPKMMPIGTKIMINVAHDLKTTLEGGMTHSQGEVATLQIKDGHDLEFVGLLLIDSIPDGNWGLNWNLDERHDAIGKLLPLLDRFDLTD